MQHSISLAVAVLSMVAGGPPDRVPTPIPAPAQDPRSLWDISTKLTLMGGDGCPCINARFTNLGPGTSTAFNFQVTQQKFLPAQKRYGAATVLNPTIAGPVPALAGTKYWQTNYWLTLESGSKYLFKIIYSPTLIDRTLTNHNVEITYTVP